MNSRRDDSPPTTAGAWLRAGLSAEFALFRRPAIMLATLAIAFVPALYAIIYVTSVWDPYAKLPRLPAALVNADRGATRAGHEVRLGEAVVQTLEQQRPFHFVRYPTETAARQALRDGAVYFVLCLPPDFSERAAQARHDAPANFTLVVSEGANFTTAVISRRFATELAHTVNEKVNAERWAALVGGLAPAPGDPPTLRAGVAQLRDGGHAVRDGARELRPGAAQLDEGLAQAAAGAHRVADGSAELAAGVAQAADGLGQVADGVRQIREKLPPAARLAELTDGSRALAAGSVQLASGFEPLVNGSRQLGAGAEQFRRESARVPLFGGKLGDGAGQLQAGAKKLEEGLVQAADGAKRVREGAEQLDAGVRPLAAGLGQLSDGLREMSERLPDPARRDLLKSSALQLKDGGGTLAAGVDELHRGSARLAAGSVQLEAGATQLSDGLDSLAATLAEVFDGADVSGLAAPVQAVVEITAPVANNGAAFAPYFMSLSLWFGAIMMTFVFYFRRLIEPLRAAPRAIQWLSKATMLLTLGLVQATVIVAVARFVLGISFVQPLHVWFVAALGSLTFVSVVLMFISILGDAGRLIAVVLLILQLAAAGGIYPVELSHGFFQAIHPYLPFTHVVAAFRATMFGVHDGDWLGHAARMGAFSVGAMLLSIVLARWRYVPRESYSAATDL